MPGKRILMLIGGRSDAGEIAALRAALEAVGHGVDLVCPGTRQGDRVPTSVELIAPGDRSGPLCDGQAVEIARDFETVDTADYHALCIPGGRGPDEIRTCPRLRAMLREAHGDGKPIAAIGHGIRALVAAPETIAGRRVAGPPPVEPEITLAGAAYAPLAPGEALRDGTLLTAGGRVALAAFLRVLLGMLGTEIVHHEVGALTPAAG